jgi:hypothetical protein
MMEYLGRCQYLLRKGDFVADVCCYVSDKNYVRWGRGEKWNQNSALAPVKGFTYDLLSSEVLAERLTFKDGRLTLPGGMSYKMLVVDPEGPEIPLGVLKKMIALVKDGATVVLGKTKPLRAPGIRNYPECDKEIIQLVNELWPDTTEKMLVRKMGEGKIYTGTNMEEILKNAGILPDFEGPFGYIHRAAADFDVYFVSGEGKADCTFRVEGKKPEIWDPVTGYTTGAASYYSTADGRTTVPLSLPENGAAFVVFRGKAEKNHFVSVNGPENSEITTKEGGSSGFIFWGSGDYNFSTARGDTEKVSATVAPPVEVEGAWNVTFIPETGAKSIEMVFERLTLWNENVNPAIKFFSGTATYTNSFYLTAEQAGSPARLQLGEVHDISQVWVNGRDMGIVWTAPWLVDITGALKEGTNELKVAVANCWANRLIGDAGLLEYERTAKTNVRLVSDRSEYKRGDQATSAQDELMPSGIVGPVRIEFGREQCVSVND